MVLFIYSSRHTNTSRKEITVTYTIRNYFDQQMIKANIIYLYAIANVFHKIHTKNKIIRYDFNS